MVTWITTFSFAIALLVCESYAQTSSYSIPEAKVEALKKGGFRLYIPHQNGISLFAVHINLNNNIALQEPGQFSGETKQKTGNYWVVEFPNELLQVGDVVNYWTFVNFNRLGYRREDLKYTIEGLMDQYPVLYVECIPAVTTIDGGKQTCIGDVIINDGFDAQAVDELKWVIENKILTYNFPSSEFNSFEKIPETCYAKGGIAHLRPIIRENEVDVRGILDLREGCTSTVQTYCYHRSGSSFILPPVKSAKISTKTSFKYGKIEIRAKLPEGEWLFSILELEPKVPENGDNSSKIWIAYSRGNDHLTGRAQDDIGSRVLFAGPVIHPTEPLRSKKLVSKSSNDPFYKDFHVYGVEWRPGKMTFSIDSQQYGIVSTGADSIEPRWELAQNWYSAQTPLEKEHVLSLGVSVGGFNDFPDGYVSGIHPKPWLNTDYRNLVRKFFDARGAWSKTWVGENPALQVDYVKVTAL